MDVIGYSLGAFVTLFLYLLPAWIGRGKRPATAILWLNILLGWTLLGWVGALVWALAAEDALAPYTPIGSRIEDLDEEEEEAPRTKEIRRVQRLKRLRDEGLITQDEFMQQIGK